MSSITPSKVTPFLMFTGRAEEALTFYADLFDDAAFEVVQRYGPEGPGAEGSVMHARLRIGDQAFMAFDSPPVHAFDFTPSLSLFVTCESEEEIDRLFARLSEGGFVMMPLSTEYGFSAKYAWLSDRFGVSWQLSLGLGFKGEG
jgi:predicted 3-demethylubiquinone-9 3-methyltransferase (glyoxalase superfamily)